MSAAAGGWPPVVADLLPRCDFPPRGSVLNCAVSGGPDSLALLILAVAAGCTVTAIHVDHGLRQESAAEAAVVEDAAALVGAKFVAETVSVAAGPEPRGAGPRRPVRRVARWGGDGPHDG